MSQDSQLRDQIIAELEWEPSVVAAHIGVTANAGVVTLSGHVESYAEKYSAEKAAGRVKGVKAVAENIEVQLPFERKRGDDDIAAAAIDRLAWDTFIPKDSVKVKIQDGWVTLTGEVPWHYQKAAAEQDVNRMSGVTGVSNQISVKPEADAAGISDNITSALHRSWFPDQKTVKVSANGGDVRLSGSVHSFRDRQIAVATAWAAPGTTMVENNITII